MTSPFDASRGAYAEAAAWFLRTAARVDGRWDAPGLGEWDVRALAGHTGRALVTVEAYLARPAERAEVASAIDYYLATAAAAAGAEVAARGRAAGEALGDDPDGALAELARRVLARVDGCDGGELLTTVAGGMRLADYLPTRTFELVVHTADLCRALDLPVDVPAAPARQALHLVAELAVARGSAGALLLTATGRPGLPPGASVLSPG